jgi:hypothetical protein
MTTPSKSKKSKTPTVEIDKTQLPAVRGADIPTVPEVCPGAQITPDYDPVKHFCSVLC